MMGQRAAWIDYSGPVAPGEQDGAPRINGISVMDHPGNPGHPVQWHVRADGWMGASFTRSGSFTIKKDAPLTLKYRLWIHDGPCDAPRTQAEFEAWAKTLKGEKL
jgi:hypothetical protein